ncbi:MAG: DUF3035 domain-containing protein [Rhodospirillales bacterium]
MKRMRWMMFGIAAALVGAGCGGNNNLFGQGKRAPDEFAVYSRAPLSLPPDYALRPPAPGTARPDNTMPRDTVRQALIGDQFVTQAGRSPSFAPDGLSPGIQVLLERTGALAADPDIRIQVNRETSILADADQSFTERLMFWRTPTEYGTVVDPAQEARRIQENQALGQPVTQGPTPTIERKRRALLEGIF